MLITTVSDKVLDCPLAILTVMGCAVPSMLYTGAVVMKKYSLAPVLAISVKVLDEVWLGYRYRQLLLKLWNFHYSLD